jgi:hypothetical protein
MGATAGNDSKLMRPAVKTGPTLVDALGTSLHYILGREAETRCRPLAGAPS